MQYVYWLGIGVVVGWIAGKRNRGQGYRILISILMGTLTGRGRFAGAP